MNNQIRIIGGKWRGRKLKFPESEGLRPTPDRLRETLFNWLMPVLPKARCLDLFAGSGSLGFEALSQGAGSVVFVERSKPVYEAIKHNAAHLHATDVQIFCEDAIPFLEKSKDTFDLIFLDPPFQLGLMTRALETLQAHPCWSQSALIYCEAERQFQWPKLPEDWMIWREKSTQEIQSRLIKISPPEDRSLSQEAPL